jgi:AcrR family transcriptional regulator
VTGDTYHHGDLRAACLNAALELLEESGSAALSIRAVARRAGVSPAAPYRHYPDREAILSAAAVIGYHDLATDLAAAHPAPTTPDELSAVALAYVRFAMRRPALFRVMFAEPCDPTSPERVAATVAISGYLDTLVRHAFPDADPAAMSTAVWALVHGLAFLCLDGKLDTATPEALTGRVRATIHTLLLLTSQIEEVDRRSLTG